MVNSINETHGTPPPRLLETHTLHTRRSKTKKNSSHCLKYCVINGPIKLTRYQSKLRGSDNNRERIKRPTRGETELGTRPSNSPAAMRTREAREATPRGNESRSARRAAPGERPTSGETELGTRPSNSPPGTRTRRGRRHREEMRAGQHDGQRRENDRRVAKPNWPRGRATHKLGRERGEGGDTARK